MNLQSTLRVQNFAHPELLEGNIHKNPLHFFGQKVRVSAIPIGEIHGTAMIHRCHQESPWSTRTSAPSRTSALVSAACLDVSPMRWGSEAWDYGDLRRLGLEGLEGKWLLHLSKHTTWIDMVENYPSKGIIDWEKYLSMGNLQVFSQCLTARG